MDIVLLVGSLAIILVAAELFTNGIEWVGHKLNLAEGAVGSVLAAVATAMPETLIPVIAILGPVIMGGTATESAHAVGVGAILGAPFMLSTRAMFDTGIAVVIFARRGRRTTDMRVNTSVLGRDVAFFIVGYAIAIGTAFLPQEVAWLKWVAAAALFVLYAVYVRLHFTDAAEESDPEDLAQLHITRMRPRRTEDRLEIDHFPGAHSVTGGEPGMGIVIAQVALALGLIIVGAQVFDRVLWVRNGKDTLAMGNITGAMVFQSCLPTVLGLLFTTWTFTPDSAIHFASAGVAFLATIVIFGGMVLRGRLTAWALLIGGPLYLVYLYLALFTDLGRSAAPVL